VDYDNDGWIDLVAEAKAPSGGRKFVCCASRVAETGPTRRMTPSSASGKLTRHLPLRRLMLSELGGVDLVGHTWLRARLLTAEESNGAEKNGLDADLI